MLERVAVAARALGATPVAEDAEALARRIGEGCFFVACVGQFKRGKSSLLNALVGQAVLPVGVLPVTTVVTVIRHGPQPRARIRDADGTWLSIEPGELAAYVTEERNPGNEKKVTGVEVYLPSPLLERGMCLVDTPGVGSVFQAATEATRQFVPQIDAALLVVGGDPPLSADELILADEVAAHVSRILVVLNKADRLTDAERREAVAFTERLLRDRLPDFLGPVLEVSAFERAAGRGPIRDWERLCAHLHEIGTNSGAELLAAARRRGLRALTDRLLHEVEEQRRALEAPIQESEARLAALKQSCGEAERALGDLSFLLTAEQKRLSAEYERHRDAFVARSLPRARAELEGRMVEAEASARDRSVAFRLALQIAQSFIARWEREELAEAERMYAQSAQRFVNLANEFLGRLAHSGDSVLARLPGTLSAELGFRTPSRLYYTDLVPFTTRTPLAWLIDLFRSPQGRAKGIRQEAEEYLERLLRGNATRLITDLDERVLESRRRLESEVRERLREVQVSAGRALEAAREIFQNGYQAVEAERARLRGLRSDIVRLSGEDGGL